MQTEYMTLRIQPLSLQQTHVLHPSVSVSVSLWTSSTGCCMLAVSLFPILGISLQNISKPTHQSLPGWQTGFIRYLLRLRDQTLYVSHWSLNGPPYSWWVFKDSQVGRQVRYAGCCCFPLIQRPKQTHTTSQSGTFLLWHSAAQTRGSGVSPFVV